MTTSHAREANTPTLTLISTQIAVTYSFQATGSNFGWARCTINDGTGELLITSDWGHWSHRWDPSSLGQPTLTTFIGTRSHVDYLAGKLQRNHSSARQFSAVATATALRHQLCTRRRADGREQLSYDEEGLPVFSYRYVDAPRWNDPYHKERLPYLTRDTARRLWNAIGQLASIFLHNADLFYERALQIDSFTDYVTENPWEYGKTEQTPGDRALRESVLPALIAVCRDQIRTSTAPREPR